MTHLLQLHHAVPAMRIHAGTAPHNDMRHQYGIRENDTQCTRHTSDIIRRTILCDPNLHPTRPHDRTKSLIQIPTGQRQICTRARMNIRARACVSACAHLYVHPHHGQSQRSIRHHRNADTTHIAQSIVSNTCELSRGGRYPARRSAADPSRATSARQTRQRSSAGMYGSS